MNASTASARTLSARNVIVEGLEEHAESLHAAEVEFVMYEYECTEDYAERALRMWATDRHGSEGYWPASNFTMGRNPPQKYAEEVEEWEWEGPLPEGISFKQSICDCSSCA